MDEQEVTGDCFELIQHVFTENTNPSEIRLEDAFTTIPETFIFFCDLFLGGAKWYNGLPFTEPLPALTNLRIDTLPFLTARMQRCFGMTPHLLPLPNTVAASVEEAKTVRATRFSMSVDENKLEKCFLQALDLNVQLSFAFYCGV